MYLWEYFKCFQDQRQNKLNKKIYGCTIIIMMKNKRIYIFISIDNLN